MTLKTMLYRSSFRLSLSTLVMALGVCAGLTGCGNDGSSNLAQPPRPATSPQYAYVASKDDNKVYIFEVNPSTGKLIPTGTVDTGSAPHHIAFDPSHKFAYVANAGSQTVSMYNVDLNTGALTPLGTPVSVPGNPVYITTGGPDGRYAYTANEAAASVSTFQIDPVTGILSPIETVPVGIPSISKETFSVTVDPTGSFVYAAAGDPTLPNFTGNAIHAFGVDPLTGKLTSLGTTPATPIAFHIAVHPNPTKPFVYLASGIGHDITTYKVATPPGPLTHIQSLDTGGTGGRAVAIEPSGKFAYVADVGTHDVRAFSIHQTTGELTPLGSPYPVPNNGGRFLAIDPSGHFLYVTSDAPSSSVTVFRINSKNGQLTELDTTSSAGIGSIGITIIETP